MYNLHKYKNTNKCGKFHSKKSRQTFSLVKKFKMPRIGHKGIWVHPEKKSITSEQGYKHIFDFLQVFMIDCRMRKHS